MDIFRKRIAGKLLPILIAAILFSCKKSSASATTPSTDTSLQQYGTPFANVPAVQDAFIYEVNIRTFSQQGNFKGVLDRLDSIKALGVNVVYLMPIYPIGILKSKNSPYCIKDYLSVNSEFGTLSGLRAIVDGAHKRNMAVMLDWVANHTSWDNSWITAHPSWYAQDSNGNIVSPPAYSDVAQLNFNNASMRLTMIQDMKYWVYAANIDGFRCDFATNPPEGFWQQAIDTLRNISTHKLLMLAEASASSDYTAGFDYNFGFNFYGQLKSIYSSNQSVQLIDGLNTSDYTGATGSQQIVRYLTNHDVDGSDGTPLDLFGGEKGSLAAFVVVAYMKGVPMIYNGQEVGLPYRLIFPFTSQKIDWELNPSLTAIYKQFIAFRNNSDAIRRGQLASYSSTDVCAFTKIQGNDTVLVISNLRNNVVNYTLPSAITNTLWTDALNGGTVILSAQLSLPPYKYLVLKK
jgi:glycosidase